MRLTKRLLPCSAVAMLSLTLSLSALAEEKVVLTEEGAPGEGASNDTANMEAGVMVRPFTGAKSKTVTNAVVSALEDAGVILIPAGFEEGVVLADAPGPYVEVARKNQIKAYVHGNVRMSKRSWDLDLKVRNAENGQIIAEPKLKSGWLPGLLKKIDAELMGVLEAPLAKASVPGNGPASSTAPSDDGVEEVTLVAEGESASASTGPLDSAPQRARSPGGPASPLNASLGVGALHRTLQYNKAVGDVYENGLQPHGFGAPALRVGVEWYPAAHTLEGPLTHLGISASFYRSVLGSTDVLTNGEATSFTTTFSELNLGLRGRIPFPGLELGINGGWGTQSLVLDGDNQVPAGQERGDPGVVPDADYVYYRFGPDVSFEFGAPIELGVFYRTVSLAKDDGFFAEDRWFPQAAGIGFDAYLSFAVGITDTLDAKIGGEARYYGLDANPGGSENNIVAGDNAYVAGAPGLANAVAAGATDTYFGGFISVEYTMPGVER